MKHMNLLSLIIVLLLSSLSFASESSVTAANADYTLFDPLVDVCELLHGNYVSAVDNDQIAAAAINGMLHSLDPYSEYIPADQVEEFHKLSSGSYEGIGLGVDVKDGYLTVISPFEGSPAHRTGVRPGDIILEVDGRSTKGWSATRSIQELTGLSGTHVTIKLLHLDDTEETVTIIRQKIQVPTIKGWRRVGPDGSWNYMLDSVAGIGYIRLSQFTQDTTSRFDRVIDGLLQGGMQSLILDLRRNPGGLMSAAVSLVDRLVDQGVIVSTRGQHSIEKSQTAVVAGTYPRFHLVVLIDQGSASASEIVAGSLQDHNRAVIVGKRSWGKGSVQQLFRLAASGAAVKITTDYYYLPKGRCVHRIDGSDSWGVEPDIEEDLDFAKFSQLGELTERLATVPSPAEVIPTPDDSVTPPSIPIDTEVDESDKSTDLSSDPLAEQLLQLDSQLAQAVKQCKGLMRARPALGKLTELLGD